MTSIALTLPRSSSIVERLLASLLDWAQLYARKAMRSGTFGLLASSALSAAWASSDRSGARSWVPEDSVTTRYFSGSMYPSVYARSGFASGLINVSPDGRYFYIVTSQGELQDDSNFYQLRV